MKDISPYIEISESTLYPILKRLDASACLATYSMEHNGRLRKYYRITNLGRARIKEFLEDWDDIMKVYHFIAGGKSEWQNDNFWRFIRAVASAAERRIKSLYYLLQWNYRRLHRRRNVRSASGCTVGTRGCDCQPNPPWGIGWSCSGTAYQAKEKSTSMVGCCIGSCGIPDLVLVVDGGHQYCVFCTGNTVQHYDCIDVYSRGACRGYRGWHLSFSCLFGNR